MIVESRAPNRVLDFGGWTDTHFARQGRVVNLAVTLFAHVTVATRSEPGVTIHILDYGDRIEVADVLKEQYGTTHDLLLAALKVMEIKSGLDVYITADVPPGCGTGSSAAITVALIKALSLLAEVALVPHELARLAHDVETEELGNECGIQDQIASAYGGLNYIDMYNYPHARVSPIPINSRVRFALESRLLVVYEGECHLSSDVHRSVIDRLSDFKSGVPDILAGLKRCADDALAALMASSLDALAEAMNRNNSLQKDLHPSITTVRLDRIEEIARSKGATGAMINGAGGGGSITLLCRPGSRSVVADVLRNEGFRILPFTVCMEPAQAWLGR